jgi:hypothetical protein
MRQLIVSGAFDVIRFVSSHQFREIIYEECFLLGHDVIQPDASNKRCASFSRQKHSEDVGRTYFQNAGIIYKVTR